MARHRGHRGGRGRRRDAGAAGSLPTARASASSAAYDVLTDKKKRSSPTVTLRSQDDHLTTADRGKIVSTSRSRERNIGLLAWMIRQHLVYLTDFTFQAKTVDKDWNNEVLEPFIKRRSGRHQFDSAGRHNLADGFALLEHSAIRDGDNGLVKLSDGTVAGLESDRVFVPTDLPETYRKDPYRWVHGVDVDPRGRARHYCVCKRMDSRRLFDTVVRARNVIWHAYPHPRWDQVRGCSPIVATLNQCQDLYEAWDFEMVRSKLMAIFGLAQVQAVDGEDDPTVLAGLERTQSQTQGEDTSEDGAATYATTENTIEPAVPFLHKLPPGQKYQVIEANVPARDTQAFWDTIIRITLMSLDIPYTFYDSRAGSYSVHRMDITRYRDGNMDKQRRQKSRHDEWTIWQLVRAIELGELELPPRWTLADVLWEWIPRGMMRVDPYKELLGDRLALAATLTSPQRVCKASSDDFFEIVDEVAAAKAYAEERGVVLDWSPYSGKGPAKPPATPPAGAN